MTGTVVLDLVIVWCIVSVLATAIFSAVHRSYDPGRFHE